MPPTPAGANNPTAGGQGTEELGSPRDFGHFGPYGDIPPGFRLRQEHPGKMQNPTVARELSRNLLMLTREVTVRYNLLQLTPWDASTLTETTYTIPISSSPDHHLLTSSSLSMKVSRTMSTFFAANLRCMGCTKRCGQPSPVKLRLLCHLV